MVQPIVMWDTVNKGASVTLSNGNLTATVPNFNNTVRASIGKTTGKWYWEITYISVVVNGAPMIGIVNSAATLTASNYSSQNARYYYAFDGKKYPEATAYGLSFVVNDVIGIALDLDNGTLNFYKNGVSQGISHTNILTMGEVFPAVSSGSSSQGNTVMANFGATDFKHPMPKGYTRYYTPPLNKILLSSSDGKVKGIIKGDYAENAIPLMTSNTSPSGVIKFSTQHASNNAYKAFDGTNTGWATTSGVGWISYEFPTERNIQKYSLKVSSTSTTYMPKSWSFEASNDSTDGINGTWTILDTKTATTNWTANEEKGFPVVNDKKYKMYKVKVTEINGSTQVIIGSIKMFEMLPPKIKVLPSKSEKSFINHGMSQSDLASVDMYTDFTDKHYIQDASSVLGSGKVFEHTLDANKVLNKITIK